MRSSPTASVPTKVGPGGLREGSGTKLGRVLPGAGGRRPHQALGLALPSHCPSPGLSNHETLQQVTRGYRLPRPASCPAEVYALMLECWRSGPEERPAFATLQEKLNAARRHLHSALT